MHVQTQTVKMQKSAFLHDRSPPPTLQILVLYKLLPWEDNSGPVSAIGLLLTLKLPLKSDPAPFQALENLPVTCIGAIMP